jgi:4-diphosphocytidyl-2-C-methyl-D-erythritol kinase
LEAVTIKLHPELKRIKERLAKAGLKSILMSGSGPAVFGIVSSRKEAVSLYNRLRGANDHWQVFMVSTV